MIQKRVHLHAINTLRLNLLDNAFDFLNCSLEFVVKARNENTQNYWKFAIINLANAIELLLKECLRREHELLIFDNLDRYKPITRETKTVNWQQLIERLKFFYEEELARIDAGRLELIRSMRNQMIHYDVVLHFPEIYHTFANLWNFVREFSENILCEDLQKHINTDLQTEFEDLRHLFYEEIVYYNDVFMPKGLRDEIEQEQLNTYITIAYVEYPRIRYGDPQEYAGIDIGNIPYFNHLCHDCSVAKGQIHLKGCDMERCPKCGGQLLGDRCVDVYEKGVIHPKKDG